MPSLPRPLPRLPTAALVVACHGCVEPPPKINSLPPAGLAMRVHVFGSSAADVNQALIAANKTNPPLHVVNEGGDGDVFLGLENDSPMCVPPTGLCSFKVSYRVRDKAGEVVATNTTSVTAQSDRCANLCSVAVNNVVVK